MKNAMKLFGILLVSALALNVFGGAVDLRKGDAVIKRKAEDAYKADAAATITNRWAYENAYLSMCDSVAGQTNHAKLSFIELQTAITALNNSNPMLAISISLQLLTLDAALKRFDIRWWDTCVWHEGF